MSFQEIIDQLKTLEPAERRQVRDAILALVAADGSLAPAPEARADEAFERLARGWCHGGGRPIADTIDQTLYSHRP